MQLDPTIALVICRGPTINPLDSAGRRGHPHFENQPGELPGGRRSAETKDLTISLVNCTGGRRRDQGSDNQSAELHRQQAKRPRIGTAFHGNVSYICVQHHCMVLCVCLYAYA